MAFIKNKENFICEHCGKQIIGNGYTNHCSWCLWSKHVDIDPGDRASNCRGMMKPVGVDVVGGRFGGSFSVIHQCVKCGYKRKNIMSDKDNTDILSDLDKY